MVLLKLNKTEMGRGARPLPLTPAVPVRTQMAFLSSADTDSTALRPADTLVDRDCTALRPTGPKTT
jgi:hypothetical protein